MEVIFMDLLIGKVTHYYDKIGVAVVKIDNHSLHTGDTVKFSGHDKEFSQKLVSMQVEHEQISQAISGMSIGIKTDQPVKQNDSVYLMG